MEHLILKEQGLLAKYNPILLFVSPYKIFAFNPQRPTVHALDKNTGEVFCQNTLEENADASFAPTSAIPGVVFLGSVLDGLLRAYETATGKRIASIPVGSH